MPTSSTPFTAWQQWDEDLPYVDFAWAGGEKVVIAREVMGPGGGGPLHRHQHVEELILVTEGEVEVTIGDDTRTLGRGEIAILPPGIFHGMKTPKGATFYITFAHADGKLPREDYERKDGKTATDPA